MPPLKNRVGIRYERLVVIKFAGRNWWGQILWQCQCDCGKEAIVSGSHLQRGCTKSCGCLNRELSIKRGLKRMGKDSPNYIHGRNCGRGTKAILDLKETIRKRDNHICQECGKTQEQNLKEVGRILSVHHIDGNDTNNDPKNMITLCKSCHRKTQ